MIQIIIVIRMPDHIDIMNMITMIICMLFPCTTTITIDSDHMNRIIMTFFLLNLTVQTRITIIEDTIAHPITMSHTKHMTLGMFIVRNQNTVIMNQCAIQVASMNREINQILRCMDRSLNLETVVTNKDHNKITVLETLIKTGKAASINIMLQR